MAVDKVKQATAELLDAILNRNWDGMVRALDAGADIHKKNQRGQTALFLAVFIDDPKYINALIKRGADINQHDNEYKTPLIAAAFLDKHAALGALLAAGADQTPRDKVNRNAHDAGNETSRAIIDTYNRMKKLYDNGAPVSEIMKPWTRMPSEIRDHVDPTPMISPRHRSEVFHVARARRRKAPTP